jgi:hypothetical protein
MLRRTGGFCWLDSLACESTVLHSTVLTVLCFNCQLSGCLKVRVAKLRRSRYLREFPSQVFSAKMRVAFEHVQSLVPGDRRNFHHVEAAFEKTTGRLMAKVVPMGIRYAGAFACTFKRLRN